MAANVLADAGFLVAVLTDRDSNRRWAIAASEQHPPPWKTCEAVLSEAFYLVGSAGTATLIELLRRGAVVPAFHLDADAQAVLALMQKYKDVPMSLADACLVRMTELLSDPILLTTDPDFRIYRRHGRQIIPTAMPNP
jgi:uncharacterized protein